MNIVNDAYIMHVTWLMSLFSSVKHNT